MELKYIFFALLIAGSNGSNNDSKMRERPLYRKFLQRKYEHESFHRFKHRHTVSSPLSSTSPPETTKTTSTTTSTYAPTTVSTTKDPFVGCEWCLNDELSVGDTFAGYCFPNPSENECYCLCGDLFCQNGQIIDRSTCVNGGSFSNCKCIDAYTPTSTSTPEPTPTMGDE